MSLRRLVWPAAAFLVSALVSESVLAAELSALRLSNATLTPAFQRTTFNYTSTVTATRTSITVTPTAAQTTSTVTVNGVAVASGAASPSIPLSTGANTITVEVNGNGVGTMPGIDVYTIVVTRQTPDTTAPTVSFTTPAEGATISGVVTVS